MPSCPAGHESATTDYCDVCGAPMSAGSATQAASSQVPASQASSSQASTSQASASPAPASRAADPIEWCPSCGGTRSGRFCEECGHDSMLPAPTVQRTPASAQAAAPAPALAPAGSAAAAAAAAPGPAPRTPTGGWTATVRADHGWYEEMRERSGNDAVVLPFPRYCPDRRFDLSGAQMLIGRRNRARGIDPEIDLSGSPMDPGVSTLHAMLLPRDGGGWEVVDLGSTNGTIVGAGPDPIPPSTPVPLADGDRIKIGAWTTITLSCAEPSEPVS